MLKMRNQKLYKSSNNTCNYTGCNSATIAQ